MRNLKKFLALALAMLMLVSCFGVAAFDDVKDDSKYAEAVSLLSDLKVIRGFSDSEFKPEENVTRWQMALMIAKLRTGKVEETDARWYDVTNTTSFNDLKVDHYYGSIGYCFGNDIILGTDATTFEPERGIMFQEALAMAVRALGYASGDDKAEMNAGYPWTFVSKAVALNLDENLEDVNYEQTLTRAQTAQLLNNMLTAAKKTGSTFAKDAFNLTQATIVLTATNKVNVLDGDPVIKQNYVQFRTLNEYGQLGAVAYHCQKSELGITDDAEKYLYNSYNVLTQDDFESFVKVNKVEAVTTAKVAKANAGKITIDGTTYKLVGKYTDLNNKPTNKYTEPEIIVLNENADYALMTGYSTTTAYPEMVLFDDNLDGQPDRGLYKEYQLGQYMSTSRIANVAGSGTTTILYNPIVVGLSVKANDKIVYSYNETANVLYVKEKAEKVSGVIGGINTATGKITVGGVEYPIGVANLPGAWTVANITTNMLGKNASIYTIDGKVVYFTDYANSSKFIVYDSYIGLNQLGYPNAYAYVQSNVKEVITISSYQFKTYQNYDYPTGISYWFNDFLATAKKGNLYTGTVDLNGYYNLAPTTATKTTSAKSLVLYPYTNNRVSFNGTNYNLTENTVYIVVDAAGNIQTAKGLYANLNLPTTSTTLLTVNANGYYKIAASSSNITYLYVQDGAFASGVQFSQTAKAADTVVYLDEDMTLVTSQQINKVDAYTWEYTYANAIDVVNGGLLPYNIVCYNYPLTAGSFYRINDGVVVEKITPFNAVAAQAEIANSAVAGSVITVADTAAYKAATKTADGKFYITYYVPGTAITGAKNSNGYITFAGEKYFNMALVGYVMIDGNIKNTDATNVAPKNFTDAVYTGAISQKAQYVYNYSLILTKDAAGNYVGGTATPNLVVIADYQTDFSGNSFPSRFVRNYSNTETKDAAGNYINPRLSATAAADSFVQYIVYRSTAGTAAHTNTNWDTLRTVVGGPATGDVNVTNALKLFAADGTFIDPVKYGLTYTLKDALVFGYNEKQAFLEVRRDPMNREVLPVAANYYMTFENNGKITLCDKVTISLANADVWYATAAKPIITSVTATKGGNQFTVFVDLANYQLTLAQVENALRTMRTTLYKNGDTKWDDVATLASVTNIYGTEFAFTFYAHQNFDAANYAFELSFVDAPLNFAHAFTFTVA
ncbi:MAG: S-layer homology domain-containing protein [Ruminococcaceae bacterium]|nr:S-layer homology domain-containing protein [Oscillospiraceae bacterium]